MYSLFNPAHLIPLTNLKALRCFVTGCMCVHVLTLSEIMVDILVFHFVVLVMWGEHAVPGTGVHQVIQTHKHAPSFPFWKRLSLRKFTVLDRWHTDQKMCLPKQSRSMPRVLLCQTRQSLNSSYYSQHRAPSESRYFYFLNKFLAVSTKLVTISLGIFQGLSHKSNNSSVKHFLCKF